jgi:ABC-type transport system involved in multi-copper enzyme maturation permease subunit
VGFPLALLTFTGFYGLLLLGFGLLKTSVIFPALISTLVTVWPVAAVLLAGCVLLQLGVFLYTRNTTESNCKQIDKQLIKEPQANTTPSDTFITNISPSAPPLNKQHQNNFPTPSAPPLDVDTEMDYPTTSAPPLDVDTEMDYPTTSAPPHVKR